MNSQQGQVCISELSNQNASYIITESSQPNESYSPTPAINKAINYEDQKKKEKKKKFEMYWHILDQKQTARKIKNWEHDKHKLKEILKESINDKRLNRALGAIFGATIGDAIGAYCEFHHFLEDEVVDQAMKMEGGGTFNLVAGQFTDDSELATHLLHGLSSFDLHSKMDQLQQKRIICSIGIEYVKWVRGRPFDIGNTTRGGINTLKACLSSLENVAEGKSQDTSFMEPMFKTIYNKNLRSMANGSLMRISPMAFFFSLLAEDPLLHSQFIKDEIRLTHPNETLAVAGVCWVNLLTQLITRKDDEKDTFAKIIEENENNKQFSQLQEWFGEAKKRKEEAMKGTPNMGFAKIGFSYGLRVLHYLARGQEKVSNQNLYKEWMWWVIKRAGDTDTNGAIAGGLMGSVVGFWDLPEMYVARSLKTITDGKQLHFKDIEQTPKKPNSSRTHSPTRPDFYQPSNVLVTALNLIGRCKAYKEEFSAEK